MSILSALTLMGNAALLTVGVANASVPVIYKGAGNLNLGDVDPPQIRLLNVTTGMIWLNFSSPAAGTAVIPVAGTTTLGTPQPVVWAAPGVEITITIPVAITALTGAGVSGGPLGFWLNTIAAAAAQTLQLQLGEGM